MDYLKILYKPKSILGLLVAVGLLFLLLGGLSLEFSEKISEYFISWGKWLLFIGIIGWLLYALPTIVKNWAKLGK
jgi:hypothetical protein